MSTAYHATLEVTCLSRFLDGNLASPFGAAGIYHSMIWVHGIAEAGGDVLAEDQRDVLLFERRGIDLVR